MNCREVEERVGVYLDRELTAAEAAEVAMHLQMCAACSALLERHRELGTAVRAALPPLRAPDVLRMRVRESLREAAPQVRAPGPSWWRQAAVAAAAVVVLAGTWKIASDRAASDALAEQVLAAHLRSLLPGHLTDVASTDQHTVKPWFDGRIDFAPPVTDEAAQGFPLVGGRLDYLAGHPAAALVYGRRLHRINVFVWPEREGGGGAAHDERNGYLLEHWTANGMSFWAVSDLNPAELLSFVRLLQRSGAGAPAAAP